MYFSKLLLADIIDFGVEHGADRMDLCDALGLELPASIPPDAQVDYATMIRALNHTGQVIQDEYLGLHLGEKFMLRGTQQVDQIMARSSTIEEAFANAVTYSKMISDALDSNMTQTERYTTVSFEVNPNWGVLSSRAVQQIIDMTLVCALKSIYWLTGKQHAPVEVHLNYPSLKKKREYYRVFDCAIKFHEETPGIIFRNPTLREAIPSHDVGLLNALTTAANETIANFQSEDPLILEIKRIILDCLPEKTNLHVVADALHLSSRTLQRKLRSLKTTYKEIEKHILIQLAKKLILHEERTIDEVGYLLGFSESSALIRFFKKEMRITPKKYRMQRQRAS